MNIKTEELFTKVPLPVMYVVTTNARIKMDGSVVMGRGAALQAKTMHPEFPKECGRMISAYGDFPVQYGFLTVRSPSREGKAGFGIFQVKNDYSEPADINLIAKSCMVLKKWMQANPEVKIRMNYPGIGNGRLNIWDVEKILNSFFSDVENLTICLK